MTEFRKFTVEDIFDVVGTRSLDAGKLNFINSGVNFVGRTNKNNGIQGKIKLQSFLPNEANTITATVIGNYKYVKFQEEAYYCSQNINKLSLKRKFNVALNSRIALYFITLIKKFVEIYNGQQSG
ncbi:MAG: restriction endonuclease subunit S, partial [Lactobacillus sp.]|nr:restriction endonuclease subunit S [Lactobacillus sp.]